MEFIIILIISGYFVVKIGNLNSRIDKLESREQITPSENTSDTATVMPRMPIKSIPVVQSSVDVGLVNNPEVENSFVHWLKQDFLMKAGALLLMLAFSWFVSFAFANNWIGPMGRIALGVLLGVAFMMVGVWRIKKYAHQGGIFTVLGASGVLLTIFAARELYDFFTPVSALAFMFLTIVFVTFVSLRYKMQSLALAALVMGAAAPLMIGSYASDATSLFSYLLVIVLGVLWVVSRTGWANLTFVALLISFLYSFPYMVFGVGSSEQDVVLLFAFVFTALFFIYNIFSITHRRENSLSKAHAVTALGTGIYIMSWISISVDDEWKSLLYVAWALVFAVGSYIAHTLSSNRTVFYLYGVTSVALIAAATAAEMSGPVLTIAYTFEVALMLVVAAGLRASSKTLSRISLLFIAPVLMSLESFLSSSWYYSAFHSDFVVLFTLAIALLAVGLFLNRKQDNSIVSGGVILSAFIGSSVYWLSIVWLVLHAVMPEDTATTLSLVIYTINGIAFYVSGKRNENKFLRLGGIALISLVIARLLFVEVWNMNIEERIVTFFTIGLLLMATAFIKKSEKEDTLIS